MDLNMFYGVAGVIGTIITIVGLIFSVVIYRKSIKRKQLVYDLSQRQGVATVGQTSGELTISLVVQQKDRPAIQVDSVYAHYVALANIGAEPIRKGDLPDTDPLRLTITRGRVLNVVVEDVTRQAIAFTVERPKGVIDLGEADTLELQLHFEFLDQSDGAVICVMTDRPDTILAIEGTVIDMKQGVWTLLTMNRSAIRRILASKWFRVIQTTAVAMVSAILTSTLSNIVFGKEISKPMAAVSIFAAGLLSGMILLEVWSKRRNPIPMRLRSAYRYSAFIDD